MLEKKKRTIVVKEIHVKSLSYIQLYNNYFIMGVAEYTAYCRHVCGITRYNGIKILEDKAWTLFRE